MRPVRPPDPEQNATESNPLLPPRTPACGTRRIAACAPLGESPAHEIRPRAVLSRRQTSRWPAHGALCMKWSPLSPVSRSAHRMNPSMKTAHEKTARVALWPGGRWSRTVALTLERFSLSPSRATRLTRRGSGRCRRSAAAAGWCCRRARRRGRWGCSIRPSGWR